ncbi:ComGF family competence protein [Halobacillus salinarum]|uniref:ComGF family competence protein n=1 Tax=Halobacillus salinarum TaxID=2932257 RepID=A0ABY4EDK6_9BACI|nr:ComGF family competence protein [Halobacillus salinarum]UOQ42532.1 ComGF family competence protein [Halobacillus salinarum]
MKGQNEKGFTMAETLVSLVITIMILGLALPLFPLLDWKDYEKELEVRQCFLFIQDELNEASTIEFTSTELVVTNGDGDQIYLEQYSDQIRRRVNGKGNELLLGGISQISYLLTESEEALELKITLKGGKTFAGQLYLPFKK